jgi:hypothetical protein
MGDMTEGPEQVTALAEQIQGCSLRLFSRAEFTSIKTKMKEYISLDIDTSPMGNSGTKKENIR